MWMARPAGFHERIEILTQASDAFTTLPGFSWQCGPGKQLCFECASI